MQSLAHAWYAVSGEKWLGVGGGGSSGWHGVDPQDVLCGFARAHDDDLHWFATLKTRARHCVVPTIAVFTPDRNHQQNVVDQALERTAAVAATEVCTTTLWTAMVHRNLHDGGYW
ncbi:MAG: hypothetical protein JO187_02310 [Acidobacteria bacterium]|nr:hypothetical protein [Acidobacteriota bacterium]